MSREKNVIIPTRQTYTNVPGRVPTENDIVAAQLALNLQDRKIYTKNLDGDIIEVGGGGSLPVEYVSETDVQAEKSKHYLFIKVGSIILPPDPTFGDIVMVSNYSLEREIILDPPPVDPPPPPEDGTDRFPLVKWDGINPIMGYNGDILIDANFYTLTFYYDGVEPNTTSELGWIIK